jgi:UPF0755 protein
MVIAAGLWLMRPLQSSDSAPQARVLIPPGATFRAAAESLSAAGVIRFPRAFSAYGSLRKRDRTIRAGTYTLTRRQSWNELIAVLHTGRGATRTVTIPEGYSLLQVIPLLARTMEVPAESLEAAVRDSSVRARLDARAETLEGYLFPDTYTFSVGSTARQLIAIMVARFEQIWRPEWDRRLAELHRTRHEIITLASIVEKEVRISSERPVVSGVYWNRLRIGMALQADPTVLYALGRNNVRVRYSDLTVDSPYNTYRRPGLPPGPIAAPGAAAIDAALNPAKVPYRYFVARPDGRHEFRVTYSEHLAAVQQIRAQARADSIRNARMNGGDSTAVGDTTKGDRVDTGRANGRRGTRPGS